MGHLFPNPSVQFLWFYSLGLLGVLGATSACRCPFLCPLPHLFFTSTDTLIRAIGKRAHPLHSMVFFSLTCVLGSTTGYASHPDSLIPDGVP